MHHSQPSALKITYFIVIAINQAYANLGYLACTATCSRNGAKFIANGCRYQQNCALAFSITPEQCGCDYDDYRCVGRSIVFNEYYTNDQDSCEAYLNNYLGYLQTEDTPTGLMQNTTQVKALQCSCSEVTKNILNLLAEQIIGDSSDKLDICGLVIDKIQDKLVDTACGKKVFKKVPLLKLASAFCSNVLTVLGTPVKEGLNAICSNTIGAVLDHLGIDQSALVARLKNGEVSFIDDLANVACGGPTCASGSTVGCVTETLPKDSNKAQIRVLKGVCDVLDSYNKNGNSTEEVGCFSSLETIQMENGNKVSISSVHVGDSILSSNAMGVLSYAPVVAVPHLQNDILTDFLHLIAENGASIQLTPDHRVVVSDCDSYNNLDVRTIKASEVIVNTTCLLTLTGTSRITTIESVQNKGIYTLVTTEEFIIVSDFTVSPYAINHAVVHAYYTPIRFIYSLCPSCFHGDIYEKTYAAVVKELTSSFMF